MATDETRDRWTLNRAGIVNVYQYENETIDLHGGRLLLRGVNGSGKSTAMNMLLPFLVTARQTRIDAAGEQTGVLKSWMLDGRDDAQPVGYLWIEFACNGEYLSCGCGIKANRQSDSVNTWWFVTDERPGIDFDLMDNKVPLSADALRAALGDRADVFAHDRRGDYRALVQRRLFDGANLDQHIGLLNVVRNPRVGDRIDVELPDHLVAALPQVSERAIADAAQPLDDLESHRRNVTELERTRDAIEGLLNVYRPYCITETINYLATADEALGALRRARAAERTAIAAHAAANEHFANTERRRIAAEAEQDRLAQEQRALEASDTYKSSSELHDLRAHVAAAVAASERATTEADLAAHRLKSAEEVAERSAVTATADRSELETHLSALLAELARLGISTQPLPPLDLDQAGPFREHLGGHAASIRRRRDDVTEVRSKRSEVERAERQMERESDSVAHAAEQLDNALEALRDREQDARDRRIVWRSAITTWSAEHRIQIPSADRSEPDLHGAAEQAISERSAVAERDRATADQRRGDAVAEVSEAELAVEHLARRTEPVMPLLDWQRDEPTRLADLIDFRDDVTSAEERAGLEAALIASGLLNARVKRGTIELETGELIALADRAEVEHNLTSLLRVTIPDDAVDIHADDVQRLLSSIAITIGDASSAAVVTTIGEFRIGHLQGRHTKSEAEFIGRTARAAALERARTEAAAGLAVARSALAAAEMRLGAVDERLAALDTARRALPSLDPLRTSEAEVSSARAGAERASVTLANVTERQARAEQHLAAVDDELHRIAATLRLPADPGGLAEFDLLLNDVDDQYRQVEHSLQLASRSYRQAHHEVTRRDDAAADLERSTAALHSRASEHRGLASRLATLEDSIGAAVDELLANLEQVTADLGDANREREHLHRHEIDAATERERASAAAIQAAERVATLRQGCESVRIEIQQVIALRGFVDAMSEPTEDEREPVSAALTGVDGLVDLANQLRERLPVEPGEPVDAESVRMSLRQRRDSIGSGWDAEAHQPVPTRPLTIEIHGPSGRGTLVDQYGAVVAKFTEIRNLLTRKQDDALRGLLQGLIAQELAEKVDEAGRLVDLMNKRLSQVRTAHDVGVELRWRRSPDLDEATERLVELLSMVPSLRRSDDDAELRRLLADRLEGARREQPDVPYRQLLGSTLDYRQWHELVVLLHRGGSKPTRLKRSTPLSEGEKKLVTYLPMFAAVAASCDALAEHGSDAQSDGPAPARFLLLDDAFAKVSEDNHPALFGLLVGLDLDFIATSERLWGTHATVPQISIVEVVRDAALRAILLEHYRWDGATLERLAGR